MTILSSSRRNPAQLRRRNPYKLRPTFPSPPFVGPHKSTVEVRELPTRPHNRSAPQQLDPRDRAREDLRKFSPLGGADTGCRCG